MGLIKDRDLSPDQRAWLPTPTEATECWPMASKIEVWDGVLVFYSEELWDWRSVSLAARTYPGWVVSLSEPGVLKVAPFR